MWNAEGVSSEAGHYVVKKAGWNADIAVGESIEFGISVGEDFKGFPAEYSLLSENTQVQEEAYFVEYIFKVTSWGKIYYIRFDEYSDNMSCFSNIFRIR